MKRYCGYFEVVALPNSSWGNPRNHKPYTIDDDCRFYTVALFVLWYLWVVLGRSYLILCRHNRLHCWISSLLAWIRRLRHRFSLAIEGLFEWPLLTRCKMRIRKRTGSLSGFQRPTEAAEWASDGSESRRGCSCTLFFENSPIPWDYRVYNI